MLKNNTRIWVIIERIPEKQYLVERWTIDQYEYDEYSNYLIEEFNVEVFYKPNELQKRIDDLEDQGKEVILNV